MKRGDVIQITDDSHPWFPSLLVVDEVRSWGVQAFAFIPVSNAPDAARPERAYNRLREGQYERVGACVIVAGDPE